MYPNLSASPNTYDAWYEAFKTVSYSAFKGAITQAARECKPGFFPSPSDVDAILRGTREIKYPRVVKESSDYEEERDMNRVLATKEKLNEHGKVITEVRSHYETTQTNFLLQLKTQYDKGLFMEEWRIPNSTRRAHRFTKTPQGTVNKHYMVDGIEIPVYEKKKVTDSREDAAFSKGQSLDKSFYFAVAVVRVHKKYFGTDKGSANPESIDACIQEFLVGKHKQYFSDIPSEVAILNAKRWALAAINEVGI